MRRLPAPLELVNGKNGDRFRLVASDEAHALLEHDDTVRPPPLHARLMLVRPDGLLGPVELFVKVTGLAEQGDARAITVKWMLITARGRRQYLIRILDELLGLNARATSQDDRLEPSQKLIYDATKQQVRLIKTNGTAPPTTVAVHEHERPFAAERLTQTAEPQVTLGQPEEPPPREGPASPVEAFFGLRTDVKDIANLKIVSGAGDRRAVAPRRTVGRQGERAVPVFRRDQRAGTWAPRGGGEGQPMACGWLGMSHVLFVVQTATPPPVGTLVEVAIPADPIVDGHIRVTAPISQLTIDEVCERSLVEVDISGQRLPSTYRALHDHWQAHAPKVKQKAGESV